MNKIFNGKAIYQPKGKASEYAKYAANFYVGCSNGCSYCYLKKGILAGTMGGDKPTLKKCFKDEEHAMHIFLDEVHENYEELKEHGLFFTFTSDPFLPETYKLFAKAAFFCNSVDIPVKFLTKNNPLNFVDYSDVRFKRNLIAFGFTLTGHDELEPNASPNSARINAMCELHNAGFKTFASIEPIIDLNSSLDMIVRTIGICDLYKIGLMSGKKYDKKELAKFIFSVELMCENSKIYFKDSLLKAVEIERNQLPLNCVDRDYNLFK